MSISAGSIVAFMNRYIENFYRLYCDLSPKYLFGAFAFVGIPAKFGATAAGVGVGVFGFVRLCMYETSAGLVFEKNFASSSGLCCIRDSNNSFICWSFNVCIGVSGCFVVGNLSAVSGVMCVGSVGSSIAFVFNQYVFNRAFGTT